MLGGDDGICGVASLLESGRRGDVENTCQKWGISLEKTEGRAGVCSFDCQGRARGTAWGNVRGVNLWGQTKTRVKLAPHPRFMYQNMRREDVEG
jgi:hypothetical protein